MKKALGPLASLRLTVVLFALSIVLIFAGTVAQKYQGNWAVVDQYFRSLWLWMPIGVYGIRVPFIGGYSLCILMLLNLIAAHAVRFKLTWKRAGIILTHAGLILLLAGELVTGLFAVEWQMPIDEGSSANYAQDIREVELAIVDPSPQDYDNTVIVPQSVLARHEEGVGGTGGEPIRNGLLPFEIRVLDWMPNAELRGPRNADPQRWQNNPATEGFGKVAVAKQVPRVTGVEGGRVDAPAAYLNLTRDGKDLGTWLVPLHGIGMDETRQPVTVGDKTYLIELRFKRDYKPYTMHLIDFRHDKFVGTEVARNFSSEIRLVDPTHNEDRTVLIYMNHPLRYRGETFFQSGYFGETRTILQVVRNPGWLMPYIACTLVSLGLIVHFGVMLRKFVGRTRR
jgi:ResB-like family